MTTPAKTLAREVTIVTGAGWDVAFWFAVFSPVLGVLVGFVALLLLYH